MNFENIRIKRVKHQLGPGGIAQINPVILLVELERNPVHRDLLFKKIGAESDVPSVGRKPTLYNFVAEVRVEPRSLKFIESLVHALPSLSGSSDTSIQFQDCCVTA